MSTPRDREMTVVKKPMAAEATPAILKQLEALGFELSEPPKVAKIRAGRIAADKLAAMEDDDDLWDDDD